MSRHPQEREDPHIFGRVLLTVRPERDVTGTDKQHLASADIDAEATMMMYHLHCRH